MEWLITIDTALLRFINLSLKNPILDATMPFFSGNEFFMPTAVICGLLILWKGKTRGFICLLLVGIGLAFGDGLLYPALKSEIGRLRPYETISELIQSGGETRSMSMPSSHAANWFCVVIITFAIYRRSLWITIPMAILVGFSRVYIGAHYPADVLVGALIGAGCGAAVLWTCNALWIWIGRNWFPLWWKEYPSLLTGPQSSQTREGEEEEEPSFRPRDAVGSSVARHSGIDAHWIRLGYIFIGATLLARLAYLGSETMQLSPDEAYQWHWSKHLALSYYSKPPMIAYAQWLGTTIWGDTAFGVRFLSPVIGAILGILLLRFFARQVNSRAGFFLLLMLATTPMLAGGALLMTVDPLSILFWTAAMLAGWKAVQDKSTVTDWMWVGLWMGLGFLSKYTALFQWLSLAVFFWLWAPARKQLVRPGVWTALLVCGVCTAPVLLWNYQHDWVTVAHVAEDAGAREPWKPTLMHLLEFVGVELGLLNPVYFVAAVWATVAVWKRNRRNPLLVYLFSMGAPLFLVYLAFSFKSRVLPNWIAPSVLPLFSLAVIYWDTQLRLGRQQVKSWLFAGLSIGAVVVLFGHDTDLTDKVLQLKLPSKYDPMRRVRGWPETAKIVDDARQELAKEGPPVFIIGSNYGMTGELSFYTPEARERVTTDPLVYCISSPRPRNQFHLWPGYSHRVGENAIFVREFSPRRKTPPQLLEEFETVTELGVFPVHRKRAVDATRVLQIFVCKGLR